MAFGKHSDRIYVFFFQGVAEVFPVKIAADVFEETGRVKIKMNLSEIQGNRSLYLLMIR